MGQPIGKKIDAEKLREIIVYGHATLRGVAEPVTEVDGRVATLIDQLFTTMYNAPGIGLAAPQVNELMRVFVVDPSGADRGGEKLAMINPEILEIEGMTTFEEGCLSIPEVFADVKRPERIRVRYVDVEGNVREREFEDIMARVIQHENDHLDGTLFVDHLSPMRRSLLRKRLREIQARAE